MNNIDKKLERIIKPPRTNFSNILYRKKNILQFFEKIDFQLIAFDRTIIKGIFFKHISKEKIKSTLIYNHSYGSCKYEGIYTLKHCHNFNMNLCIYDSRGSGETSNSFVTFGFSEKIDLLYVILKCFYFFKFDRFILWGRSIGCNAVLQFYQTMISHESSFLNNVYKKQNSKNEYYNSSSKNRQVLPKNFNKFVHMYYEAFLRYNFQNNLPKTENLQFKFIIQGIVLDSPYTSFDHFISDNLKKFVPYLSGVLALPVRLYLKSWLDSKINIDLDKKQNIDLIQVVNLNAVILISDKDEVVPLEKFEMLVKNFASKCGKKNKPRVYNTKQKHGSVRKDNLMNNTLKNMIKNIKPINTYIFSYKQKNPFIEKLLKINTTNIDGIRLAKNLVNDKSNIDNLEMKPKPSIDDISGGRTFAKNLENLDIDNIILKLQTDIQDEDDSELNQKIDKNLLENPTNYEIYKNKMNNFSPDNRKSAPIHLINNMKALKINNFQSINNLSKNPPINSHWNKIRSNFPSEMKNNVNQRKVHTQRNKIESFKNRNFRQNPILNAQIINNKRKHSLTHTNRNNTNLIYKNNIFDNNNKFKMNQEIEEKNKSTRNFLLRKSNSIKLGLNNKLIHKNNFGKNLETSIERKNNINIFEYKFKKIHKSPLPKKQYQEFQNLIKTEIHSKLKNINE